MTRSAVVAACLVAGCGDPAPKPAPAPPPPAAPVAPPPSGVTPPAVEAVAAPGRCDHTNPHPIAGSDALTAARAKLVAVVESQAFVEDNPWAVAHGILALGLDHPLPDGSVAIDRVFADFAEHVDVEGHAQVRFPRSRGAIRIEPHTDLILKQLTELGAAPDRSFVVQGQAEPLLSLYRGSLFRAWSDGASVGFDDYNDAPWALQALSSWAPPGLSWQAAGGHVMTMDALTHDVVSKLHDETSALRAGAAAGQVIKKDTRQGIFRYTCGGHHLVQGAAAAVARGFGSEVDRQQVCDQLAMMPYRTDVELGSIDPMFKVVGNDRGVAIVLLTQRLKYLGHTLETVSKMSIYGQCVYSEADAAHLERVAAEVVKTVSVLDGLGVLEKAAALRTNPALEQVRGPGGAEQAWLDLIGDSAHAIRGIDLATGAATLCY